ncbi:HD-GYP domain-containing protein [Brevibacillus fluminis]|uniref:HD-GYP domain-containing protein n=1 Tax=Brevibacillus fluminis TaxID=511487 RepID=UPI003F896058
MELHLNANEYETDVQPDERLSQRSIRLLQELKQWDHDTYMHSHQVACYAVELGKAWGANERTLADLYVAGWLHDLGKLRIPVEILQKTTKLADSEFAAIKLHPIHSAALIHQEGYSPHVLEGILTHHERMDGKGYPFALPNSDIRLIGRILQVVDAFSAMTTNRAYRESMTVDRAVQQLYLHAHTQFDPALVTMFCERVLNYGKMQPG